MEFSYENITLSDLDVEFKFINFEIECDADRKLIIIKDYVSERGK